MVRLPVASMLAVALLAGCGGRTVAQPPSTATAATARTTTSPATTSPASMVPPRLVDQLVGWFWQIRSTTLDGVTTRAASGSRAAINFSMNDLDACDDTGADWHSFDGAAYGLSTITMRGMSVSATPYQGTRIEDAYAAVLRDTVTATVVGTSLTLSAHGGMLVYTRAHAAPYKSDFLAPLPAQEGSPVSSKP